MAKPNPLEGAKEIQGLLVDYAKQETIDPLKTLGRFLIWGIVGAVLVFLGVFFLGIGTLRLTQELLATGAWWSVLAYLITLVVLAVAMVIIYLVFSRSKKEVLS